jgi:murein DD-endopeptidase MepM/ murein hydrolase activator NlpD
MQKVITCLAGILIVLISFHAEAQKKGRDFLQIKAPTIEYSTPDVDESLFEENFSDTSTVISETGGAFNPHRSGSIVSEDTTYYGDEDGDGEEEGEGETSIVEVAEQLNIDSVWVTIAEYYAIWDSRNVDPYKIDPSEFKDTLKIQLYDTLSGQFWSMPMAQCRTTSGFGYRWHRWHYGTDIGLNVGDPIMACFDGIVRIARYNPSGYGNYVLIRHYNGLETLYGHMSAYSVEVGQFVKSGEVIGMGGNTGHSTGPHLHFEVRYAGNAFDATTMYDFQGMKLRNSTFTLSPEHYAYAKEARKVYYHKVRPGDTLGRIAAKYGISTSRIAKLNRISTRATLRVGQRLRIR